MSTLKENIKVIIRVINSLVWRLIYLFYRPAYPQNPKDEVLIHLGCGEINSKEFINVDTRYFSHLHHIHNIEKLNFFSENFADLIYISHALEHFPMRKVKDVLSEWKRVLKPNGILRLSVPDFDKILTIYFDNEKNIEAIWMPLFGGQEYKHNYHYSVYNQRYLTHILEEIGFREIKIWEPEKVKYHNFEDWASKKIIIDKKIFPISLNIEAVK